MPRIHAVARRARELENAPAIACIARTMARNDPLPALPTTPANGLYRHYKGHLYEVVGIVRHSEELAPYVLYRCLDEHGQKIDDVLWVRPHAMWSEPVTHEGRTTPRFAPVAS